MDADDTSPDDGNVPVGAAESRKTSANAGAADAAPTAPQATYVTKVAEDGFVPSGAMVPGIAAVFPFGSDRWFPIEINGSVQGVELTMTWNAENPTTERMLLSFGKLEREGNSQYSEVYRSTIGTSPLTLSLEGLDWDDEDYVVWAWFDHQQPAVANFDQPFSIEGTITSVI